MFHARSWFVVVALLALWSLAVWTLHALAAWTVASAGTLSGAATGVGTIARPDGLASWVPPQIAQAVGRLLSGPGPVVDKLQQAAPALAGGVTVAAWRAWGIGSVLLVLLGTALHGLFALWRRRAGASPAGVGTAANTTA